MFSKHFNDRHAENITATTNNAKAEEKEKEGEEGTPANGKIEKGI